MLKEDVQVVEKRGIHFILDEKGKPVRFTPWLGDSVSFLYDIIMKRLVIPRKLGGDMERHYEILREILSGVHGKRVIEVATGTGSVVNFLPWDNHYTGTDISPGLLRKAAVTVKVAGFAESTFYVAQADDLPFTDDEFDVGLCILSLNFFPAVPAVLREMHRVLVPGGVFVCSAPAPERNHRRSTIRGTLYPEKKLRELCQGAGLSFDVVPEDNGTLLYFTATVA